jgi:hypothetical protein
MPKTLGIIFIFGNMDGTALIYILSFRVSYSIPPTDRDTLKVSTLAVFGAVPVMVTGPTFIHEGVPGREVNDAEPPMGLL